MIAFFDRQTVRGGRKRMIRKRALAKRNDGRERTDLVGRISARARQLELGGGGGEQLVIILVVLILVRIFGLVERTVVV